MILTDKEGVANNVNVKLEMHEKRHLKIYIR